MWTRWKMVNDFLLWTTSVPIYMIIFPLCIDRLDIFYSSFVPSSNIHRSILSNGKAQSELTWLDFLAFNIGFIAFYVAYLGNGSYFTQIKSYINSFSSGIMALVSMYRFKNLFKYMLFIAAYCCLFKNLCRSLVMDSGYFNEAKNLREVQRQLSEISQLGGGGEVISNNTVKLLMKEEMLLNTIAVISAFFYSAQVAIIDVTLSIANFFNDRMTFSGHQEGTHGANIIVIFPGMRVEVRSGNDRAPPAYAATPG